MLLQEEGASLTVTTINRILKRRGLVGKKDSNAPAMERFERSTLNELWQMDGKGEYRGGDGTCYPLSILDDHSRYAVGSIASSDARNHWFFRWKSGPRPALPAHSFGA